MSGQISTPFAIVLCAIVLGSCTDHSDGEEDWTQLFDGRSLAGWHIEGDSGRHYVEDGTIISEIVPTGGSYLATDDSYNDFMLEAEVHIDSTINSGIQVRASRLPRDTTISFLNGRMQRQERTFEAGRVTGYQIEVDPSERAWTGGLYEPSLRGWLVPLVGREDAQNAFKGGTWNAMRVLVHGDTIRSWLNGIPIVDTTDSVHCCGWIGLQAHSANTPEQVGKTVRWRNIRIKTLD